MLIYCFRGLTELGGPWQHVEESDLHSGSQGGGGGQGGWEGLSLRAEAKGGCYSGFGKLRAFPGTRVVELG